MKRLPLLGVMMFGLAALTSCVAADETTPPTAEDGRINNPTTGGIAAPDSTVACYDTGHGVKCVERRTMPLNSNTVCTDNDGDTNTSGSSSEGPSPSDNSTSDSSDGGNANFGGCNPSDSSESGGDSSGNSDSDTHGDDCNDPCGDADNDGVPNAEDCDCVNPDDDPPPPPPHDDTNDPPGGGDDDGLD